MAYPNAYLTTVHQLLNQHFNREELTTLCFNLGVDYDDLSGAGKSGKARELVLYLDRRDQIPKLESIIRTERPEIVWPQLPAGTPPAPISGPAGGIQIDPNDFERLVAILQGSPQFLTAERRLVFLEEVFYGSPRKRDILGRFDVSGTPHSAATRLVNWLIQFGQDMPGRETLGMLIETLLGTMGEGTTAQFLRGLLDRYPF